MTKIPRIFHFVFGLRPQTEPFHLSHYLAIQSCIEINNPEKVIFHYEHTPYGEWWDKIKDKIHLNPIKKNAYMNDFQYENPALATFRYAHLSDISRLEILLEYGGVYADIDTVFVKRIPDDFFEYPCVMGMEKVDWNMPAAKKAGGSLCNAFIMAEKNSAFIKEWLHVILDEFDGTWSAHSTFLPYRLSKKYPDTIHIEPENAFFYCDWSKAGIQHLFNKSISLPDNVYSLHLWSHLWWDKKRCDFTYFHEGRLTANYVSFGNTTYSNLTRRFLPSDTYVNVNQYKKEVRKNYLETFKLFFQLKKGL